MKKGDKVVHPEHPGEIGEIIGFWADSSIEARFGDHLYDLPKGSFNLISIKKPKKLRSSKYHASSGRRQPLPCPTASPDGLYRLWDRPRGYVAEILNADPDLRDRITSKEKTIEEPERTDLLEWAQKFLDMFPIFKPLVLDLIDAAGGDKISIQFPWEVVRWFSLMTEDQFERLIPVIRAHRQRAAEFEAKKQ